jgi:hypothetical protein
MRAERLAPISAVERWSLVVLWLGTALVSALGWAGISVALVRSAGWVPHGWAHALVGGGLALDLAIGLWLAWVPSVMACRVAFAAVVVFTLLASAMVPFLWLHPLGPLLKNLPILALLWRGCDCGAKGRTA